MIAVKKEEKNKRTVHLKSSLSILIAHMFNPVGFKSMGYDMIKKVPRSCFKYAT